MYVIMSAILRSIWTKSIVNVNSTKFLSSDTNSAINEDKLINILRSKLDDDKKSQVYVEDISGGCGAMFQIHVVSDKFRVIHAFLEIFKGFS